MGALKDISSCRDERELESFLKDNTTIVSHDEYCRIVNSFFFHDFDIELFFRYRRSITLSNKVSYKLYKPSGVNATASVSSLNRNYDTLLRYNVVLDASSLLLDWDIQPSLFGFLDHLLEEPPEILPNFPSWVLISSCKSDALSLLSDHDIKLSYYPVTPSLFNSLSRLDRRDCELFLDLLDKRDIYTPYLRRLSNFSQVLSVSESNDKTLDDFSSHDWDFDDQYIRIYPDFRPDRCIGNHPTNVQMRLINRFSKKQANVCDRCINSIDNPRFTKKRDQLSAYLTLSRLDLEESYSRKELEDALPTFRDTLPFIGDLPSPKDYRRFKNLVSSEERDDLESLFLYDKMKQIVGICKKLISNYSL